MASAVRIDADGRLLAEMMFEPICRLYDEVFSLSPFAWTDAESQQHRDLLSRLMNNPAFGIVVAEVSGNLIGFAYGVPLRPETEFWQNFLEPVPEEATREWPGRTFLLVDLAVDEDWRGQGLGRELTEKLLAARTEQRAVLSVQPAATATQEFYRHLGWRLVGRQKMPPGTVSSMFDIYVTELSPQP